jgi:hypothetical protein
MKIHLLFLDNVKSSDMIGRKPLRNHFKRNSVSLYLLLLIENICENLIMYIQSGLKVHRK